VSTPRRFSREARSKGRGLVEAKATMGSIFQEAVREAIFVPTIRSRSVAEKVFHGSNTAASMKPMDIRPIKTQRDYRRVLKDIEGLMTAKRNTPQGDRLDVLVTLVEAFEAKHYPLDLADAVDALFTFRSQTSRRRNANRGRAATAPPRRP
jgi:hypothetical protein